MSRSDPPLTGYCPVPNGELYFEASGSGPTVVCIHAGIANLRMWDAQVVALADAYRVVCFDCRGFGRSRSAPGPFANHADVIALLDHLGIAQAHVVGCSRGGMIGLDVALAYPARVAALAWVCSGISGFNPPEQLFHPDEIALFTQMEALEQAGAMEQVAALDVRLWVDGPLQPAGRAAADVRRIVYEMARDNYRTAMVPGLQPQPLDPPALSRLNELHIPLLAVIGDLDSVASAAAATVLADAVPQIRVAHFPDCAHLPNLEQPERFNELLRAFLDGLQ